MKILMLSWEYPPRVVGGISRVVHDLSHKLIQDGHNVTVVTYRDGNVPYYEDDGGVDVYRVDNFMISPNNFIDWIMQLNFNMIAKVGEIIAEKGGFDVIHAHDWLTAYAGKTLKNAFNTPLVSTIHATEAGRNSGIQGEMQKYINDTEWMLTYESSEVIVNSNYMKNELQRLFGLPYEKINVVPNGVNLNLFNGIEKDYDFRRKYAMDNEKIILFMGRLVYEKGIQNLIAAMPKVLAHYNDAKLVVAGKGGMIDELKSFSKITFEADLKPTIAFTFLPQALAQPSIGGVPIPPPITIAFLPSLTSKPLPRGAIISIRSPLLIVAISSVPLPLISKTILRVPFSLSIPQIEIGLLKK